MWVLYAVLTILLAYQCAVYAHSYVYITSSTHIVSYSFKSQSFELVHSFTDTFSVLHFLCWIWGLYMYDSTAVAEGSVLLVKWLVQHFDFNSESMSGFVLS